MSMNANIFEKRNLLDIAILLKKDDAMFWLLKEKGATPTSQNVESAKVSANKSIKDWGHHYGSFLNRYDVGYFKDGLHVSSTCRVFGAKDVSLETDEAGSKEKENNQFVLKFMTDKTGGQRKLFAVHIDPCACYRY